MREVNHGIISTYKEGNRKGLLVKVGKLLQPPCADGVLELHDDSFAPLLVDAVVMVADPWTLVVEGKLFSSRDVAFVAHLAKNLLQLWMLNCNYNLLVSTTSRVESYETRFLEVVGGWRKERKAFLFEEESCDVVTSYLLVVRRHVMKLSSCRMRLLHNLL